MAHTQMFITPDGYVWSNSVYGYNFFKRYLSIFEEIRLVTRMKKITYEEVGNKVLVSGPCIEFYPLPFYHGPWEYAKKYFKIKRTLKRAVETCDCAILRIPDQLAFMLFIDIKRKGLPCAVEVVAHSWDLYAPGTTETLLRPLLRLVWDFNQRKICKQANGVSYVTEKYLQKRYSSKVTIGDKKRFESFFTSADLNDVFFEGARKKESFQKEVLSLDYS